MRYKIRKRIIERWYSNGEVEYICQKKLLFVWITMVQNAKLAFCFKERVKRKAIFRTYQQAAIFLRIGEPITKIEVTYDSKYWK